MRETVPNTEPSDADLMRRAADGDRDAFAAIYQRHHASIYRFARLMTGSSTIAEDVVQDVFLAVMRDAARYAPERALLSTYLYGIARHQTRRRLARERRFAALTMAGACEPAAPGDLVNDWVHASEIDRLRRAILTLPSRYREVIVLCELQDVPYAQAAATLGCATGTIRSRLHRARQLLATKFQRADARIAPAQAGMRCAV
jgi:RNA polymerase sigma-70 factor (ECF subfamily)